MSLQNSQGSTARSTGARSAVVVDEDDGKELSSQQEAGLSLTSGRGAEGSEQPSKGQQETAEAEEKDILLSAAGHVEPRTTPTNQQHATTKTTTTSQASPASSWAPSYHHRHHGRPSNQQQQQQYGKSQSANNSVASVPTNAPPPLNQQSQSQSPHRWYSRRQRPPPQTSSSMMSSSVHSIHSTTTAPSVLFSTTAAVATAGTSFPAAGSSGGRTTRSSGPQQQQQQQQQDHDGPSPVAGATTTPTNTTTTSPSSTSFSDWLTSGALDLLRLAGGVTLSTTGALVTPPIQIAQTILLPAILAYSIDFFDRITSQRVKDWVRIVTSSITHIISVLTNTPKGKEFYTKVIEFISGDVIDILSSDETRQVLMDGMACTVKFTEALHTPEVYALLQQMSVLACRVIDAASSGKSKQLICDFNEVVWSGVNVLADPTTTLALAEVTAYLCHALEMQDATEIITTTNTKGPSSSTTNTNNNNKTTDRRPDDDDTDVRRKRRRRHNRQELQGRIYTHPVLLSDPDATVEQVILSSLGVGDGVDKDGDKDGRPRNHWGFETDDDDEVTLDNFHDLDVLAVPQTLSPGGTVKDDIPPPPKVVVTKTRSNLEDDEEGEHRTTPKVGHTGGTNTNTTSAPMDWNEHARNEVNVEILRERIGERAAILMDQRQRRQPLPQQQQHLPQGSLSSNNPTSLVPLGLHQNEEGNARVPVQANNSKDKRNNISNEHQDLEDLVTPGSPVPRIARRPEKNVKDKARNNSDKEDEAHLANELRNQRRQRRDGETAVDHFYRILDEVMEEQRDDGVNNLLSRIANSLGPRNTNPVHHPQDEENNHNSQDQQKQEEHHGRAWNLRADTATTTGEGRRGLDTVRRRLSSIRNVQHSAAAGKQPPTTTSTNDTKAWLQNFQRRDRSGRYAGSSNSPIQHAWEQHRIAVLVGLGVVSFIIFVFVSFALYGMYTFFFPSGIPLVEQAWGLVFSKRTLHEATRAVTLDSPTTTSVGAGATAAKATSEVVIRIIREVVHVTEDGTILKTASTHHQDDSMEPSPEQLEQLAECVSANL